MNASPWGETVQKCRTNRVAFGVSESSFRLCNCVTSPIRSICDPNLPAIEKSLPESVSRLSPTALSPKAILSGKLPRAGRVQRHTCDLHAMSRILASPKVAFGPGFDSH